MSKRIIEYQGKKYALVSDTEENECERCALREACHEDSDLICKQFFTDDEVTNHRLVEVTDDALTEQNRDEIRRTLQADNLWTDSLALDLDELAQQKTFIDRLTEQMNQPGYQDTFTIPRKDVTMMPTLNPLHEYRDKAVAKFQQGMERLRAEAIKRKLQARQFK